MRKVSTKVLIGAGGHARSVAEMFDLLSVDVNAFYVDPEPCPWLSVINRYASDQEAIGELEGPIEAALGLGGKTPLEMAKRLNVAKIYSNIQFPSLVHHRAYVSPSALLNEGVQVLAGAVLESGAELERFCVVNIGALLAHDCAVGEGSLIAPGAILCGGVKVGRCCVIGAGSVILSDVPDNMLVKANTRYHER